MKKVDRNKIFFDLLKIEDKTKSFVVSQDNNQEKQWQQLPLFGEAAQNNILKKPLPPEGGGGGAKKALIPLIY